MTGNVTAEEGLPKTIEFEVAVAEIQSERGAAMDKKMHAALKKEEQDKEGEDHERASAMAAAAWSTCTIRVSLLSQARKGTATA